MPVRPEGAGLGYISNDYGDIFRPLHGDLVDKDPYELKPPYKVRTASLEEAGVDYYPYGVLRIKARLPEEKLQLNQVAQGEYMKWAIAEALSESVSRIGKVRMRPDTVLFCAKEVEIMSMHTPYVGQNLWQFCEFRFDYRLKVKNAADGSKLAESIFMQMGDFEADFCKVLEFKFRNIYRITILGLNNKRFALMDGQKISNEVQLFEAAQRNDTDKMSKLVSQCDVNVSQKAVSFPAQVLDEDLHFSCVTLSRTPLLAAAEEGHCEAMRLLFSSKADVSFQDNSGFHALYLAAGAPNDAEKAVNLLLAWDADVNLANSSGYTALHNACGSGEVGAIKALLEAKADINSKSKSGAAPIHTAVVNDQPAALEALESLKANLDMPAFGGNTPVHEGVMQNNPDIIKKLFDLNADINIESGPENGYATPLRMAIDRKKKKAAKKLRELGALEKIEHEYADSTDGEFEAVGDGEYQPRVKGRFYY
mmetsp:Transcript_23756/g.66725  ORF Transcript_23756/g.66725 Transcript_23756/m.66725 type:complete len:480 (-) Transcript_23756:101-1540(-)